MQFRDAFTVPVDPEQTWRFVLDVPRVLQCLPGIGDVNVLEEGRYETTMTQRVGPFSVRFHVDAEVAVFEDEQRMTAKGAGRDRRLGSGMEFQLELRVEEMPEGSRVLLDSDVTVRGPLAQLGMPLMQHKAKETFQAFGQNVKQALEAGA